MPEHLNIENNDVDCDCLSGVYGNFNKRLNE